MKKFTTIAAASVIGCLATSGVAVAADTPSTHQDFEAKVFAGSKQSSTPKKGSVGAFLKPFHNDTWPATGGPKPLPVAQGGAPVTEGALMVSPPFATTFAYVYLDKNVTFNPNTFPACPRAKVEALSPENNFSLCPKGSVLGKGKAEGFARVTNSAPGVFLTATELDTRVIATGKKNLIYLFTYGELTKGRIITGTVQKAKGQWGQRIKFLLPQGLINPSGVVSQLSSFDAAMPAQKSPKGKALMTLKKCPKGKKLKVGYQGNYSTNAKPKPTLTTAPVDGDDFVTDSSSPIIVREGKCK